MKKTLFFLLAVLLPLCADAQYQDVKEEKRTGNRPLSEFAEVQRTLFNFGWKFRMVTPENRGTDFAAPTLDDSDWRILDLPHDFQWEQPWDEQGGGARGFKPMCEGWYRKTFVADEAWEGLQVKLDIGGIIYLGDVYLNGEKIASTEYGYVGMEVDLTSRLKWGEANTVAVYASTGPKKGSRWYTGGGLFRDVYLQLMNPTHIARHGVYITTPEVSAEKATVQVQVEVSGWQKRKNVRLRTRLLDADGNAVGSAEAGMPRHTKQSTTEVKLPLLTLKQPHLWSTDTPYLYNADVIVEADGMVVDSLRETFGIRWMEFSPEFGFRLNGQKIFLQGNSGHHDMGALGAAAFDTGIERMMRRLKAFGYNTIRCSHNPYSDSFARIADRVGMLVVDELTDKWSDRDYWGGRQPFTHIWPELLTEWVKRDRNRPSIILWSLGNELQIRNDWAGLPGMNDWGVTTYRVLDQVVKRWDNTRKTTVAMFPARAGYIAKRDSDFNSYLVPPELACVTEVASFNYQSDKYAAYVAHAPHLIVFQSEAETSAMLAPFYNMNHETMVGMAYWGAIEYWGESNAWPKKGWNYSFFNHTLRPYPQAWLVRSAFIPDEPLVRIGVIDAGGGESVSWNDVIVGRPSILDHWNFAAGSQQNVVTYTNAHSVELFVNGKSLGTRLNDATQGEHRNVILWNNVAYPGAGEIVAVARDAEGREVTRHSIRTAGKATRLTIEPETAGWTADGMSLLYMDVTATDRRGSVDPTYTDSLTVSVEGAATLLALDNGDHYTSDLFHGIHCKPMKNGRMQIILRSKREAGPVKVTVSAGKLKRTFKVQTQEKTAGK
ncbi:MAG: DUF4982 domain-containing protein [Bacteroides sp.]|nr:DUF4982 domain-containing protein [Bacteroides sp.]